MPRLSVLRPLRFMTHNRCSGTRPQTLRQEALLPPLPGVRPTPWAVLRAASSRRGFRAFWLQVSLSPPPTVSAV